ncbi:peptidoglycan/LPS O-acetylase OafA/YrhL [Epilithonimonas hungarica]|uniref:acyltransferase family protein n=1 Tax=Epilithonimonas hungarica TaxID=454006 RepID=UPI00278AA910|nr:acyltransferase family protein [Epilithonimonas hungarica]MDP9956826.1 peptidoglycan/LPS O-acetylase OafA/YrhL [Epilithonimonas hungarica]
MKFRTDISFLRAVSVLIVMLFHFQVKPFDGGFIGVDVFFVISGFLMTQIILKGVDDRNFSLKKFYTKRIDRIIPPLQILLAFVILISMVFFFKSDLRLNAKFAFLADFFVSNIYFWKYIDYFSSTDNILLHTWSLGVEWQFYLIYPLIILLLIKIFNVKEKIFWSIMSLLTLISLGIMIFTTQNNNNFAFYMLPSRFWELSIGGMAYIIGKNNHLNNISRNIIAFAGIIAILLCSILISEKNIWPSYYTIIPVLSTVAVLALNIDAKIFNNKFAKFFGDISYSLYLWHWPWFVFFKYFGFIDGYYTLILIILSIISAYLSFRFIERNKKISNIYFSSISSLIIAFISAFIFIKPDLVQGISIYQNRKFEIADYENRYKENGRDKQFYPCHCGRANDYDFKNCLKISSVKKNVLIIGDSHSAQYSSSFRSFSEINFLETSVGYVLPFPDSRGSPKGGKILNYIFKEFIPKNHKRLDLVIISAHWLMKNNPRINYNEEDIKEGVLRTIAILNKYDVNYLYLGQTETYKLSYPKIIMLKKFGRNESEFINPEASKMNDLLKSIIPANHYLDLYENKAIYKLNQSGKIPYMFDTNHYSKFGADQVFEKLIKPKL